MPVVEVPALATVLGQVAPQATATGGDRLLDSPLVAVLVLAAVALVSFAIIMLTSFVKIAVVLSVMRSALGTPQIPPTTVITGLAFVLSLFIMSPVIVKMIDRARPEVRQLQKPGASARDQAKGLISAGVKASGPLKAFLQRHAHARDRQMFLALSQRLHEPKQRRRIKSDSFLVLVPAFLISELKEAFQIGFFIFIPFLIIDLVVSNILLALGMHMLTPTTVSLPFKFLLFVLVDGWHLLTRGLIAGYF